MRIPPCLSSAPGRPVWSAPGFWQGAGGFGSVHLVDAGNELGGSMRSIPRLPGLGEWGRAVDYRRVQLDKLKNVEINLKATLDAKKVREYGADIVVIATGSRWAEREASMVQRTSPFQGQMRRCRIA